MNKKIIISVIIVLSAILIIGWYFFQEPSPTEPQATSPEKTKNAGNTEPAPFFVPHKTGQKIPPSGEKMAIQTENKTYISVNNFYKRHETQVLSGGYDAVLSENENYGITYYAEDQGFAITLTGENLHTARDTMEAEFLKILGITKDQACQLLLSVAVPISVDEEAAGVDYGLSFCPNGKPLP